MIKQPTLSMARMTEFRILSRAALTLQIFQAEGQGGDSLRGSRWKVEWRNLYIFYSKMEVKMCDTIY